MKLFTRFSTTVAASVEKAVNQIENHDAIVEASLSETRKAAAKAQVRLARVRKDGERMRKRVDTLVEDERRWEERASSVASTDEERALECLRRRKVCRQKIEVTTASLAEHTELETRLLASVQHIQGRLEDIAHQRNKMRSRQSVADAMRVLDAIDGDYGSDIEDTFDRWEIMIGASELATPTPGSFDSFDDAFMSEEDDNNLRSELEALVNSNQESN